MIDQADQVKVLLSGISTKTLAAELHRRKADRVAERAKALRVANRLNKFCVGDLDVLDTLATDGGPMLVSVIGHDIGMVQQGVRRVLDRLVAKGTVKKNDTRPATYSILQRGRDVLKKETANNTFPDRA